ncbi:hypothetical protein C8Q73DRAFT_125441 [Cubamyces lactineus]|nr:hypothetical protein C8Q73DRAFT_125178 [Cubamyces lactineus]KAH9890423.1 hypothetical protein C8Q73DRAFT_125441 [Cubamyces lactineus]
MPRVDSSCPRRDPLNCTAWRLPYCWRPTLRSCAQRPFLTHGLSTHPYVQTTVHRLVNTPTPFRALAKVRHVLAGSQNTRGGSTLGTRTRLTSRRQATVDSSTGSGCVTYRRCNVHQKSASATYRTTSHRLAEHRRRHRHQRRARTVIPYAAVQRQEDMSIADERKGTHSTARGCCASSPLQDPLPFILSQEFAHGPCGDVSGISV